MNECKNNTCSNYKNGLDWDKRVVIITKVIEFQQVTKVFSQGKKETRALDGLSLKIARGEFVAIMGPSGSGKSTLLHLAGALDLPSSGKVFINGKATSEISDGDRTLVRRRKIGFVFQFFNLIPTLTVEENIGLAALLDGTSFSEIRSKVAKLLDIVGLAGRANHLPEELSGGEMQRTAIARALVTDPEIILADEPTGNLDSVNGDQVMDLIKRVSLQDSKTVVIVTHDPRVARFAGRTVTLRDGKVDESSV